MQQPSHSGQQICSVSRKPIQGQAENSSPEHRLSFKQQYYNCSGPKRWLQTARETEKEKSIKWTSYSIRSSVLDLHCTHLSPVLPGHTGTWQHQEEILTELKAKREIREAERREQAGLGPNTPALSSTLTCGKQSQGTCAPVWPTPYSSLDIDPNLTPVD